MKLKCLLFFFTVFFTGYLKPFIKKIDDQIHPRVKLYKAILGLEIETINMILESDPKLSYEAFGELYKVTETEYLTMSQVIDRIRPLTRQQRKKLKEKGELIVWWDGDMIPAWLDIVEPSIFKKRIEAVLAKRSDQRSDEEDELLKVFARDCRVHFNVIVSSIHSAQERVKGDGFYDPVLQKTALDTGCCIS